MSFEQSMKIKGELLGVDIGFDTIKIVALKKNEGANYFRSYNIVKIPPKSIEKKDSDSNILNIAQTLDQARKSAKPRISQKLAVSGLPESKVFTKIIQVPKMSDEELKTAIPNEAVRHIPIPPSEIYLDWQNLDGTGKVYDILIVASPKFLVENYVAVFKKIGLNLIAIETKAIAASRSIIQKGEKNTILILDIGAAATGISISDNSNIKFTYTIPHGGNTLTKSIATGLNISEEKAEELKRKQGFRKDHQPEVIKAMSQVMNDILEEVNNAIKFFESRTEPPREITEIRVCGGAALTPEITTYVSEATHKKTNIANPLMNVAERSWKKRLAQDQILRLTTAVGLALRERY